MKAILIDDEEDSLKVLEAEIIRNCPQVEIIQSCLSGKEALLAVKSSAPDLIFLDIDMPYMNGFEFIELLPSNIQAEIIFVTAHNEYAIQAIKTSAVDYLLKPVNGKEISTTVKKIQQKRQQIPENKYQFLLEQLEAVRKDEMTKVALPTFEGLQMVVMSEIIYCEADDNYAEVYLTGDRKIHATKTLRFIQDILPKDIFFRNHKSFLVNLKRIEKYVKMDGGYLVMDNGTQIALSRSKRDEIIALLSKK